MSTRIRVAALLGAALAAVGVGAASARADGDPASDYLLVQKVFLPYDLKFAATPRAKFLGLVAGANRAGYMIRIAIIGGSYDLGAIPSLWLLPKTYARFLGAELSFVYKGRLLVVMPNGVGFNWPGHSAKAAYALLGSLKPGPTPADLLAGAQTAVEKLTAAAGVKVVAPRHVVTPAQQNSHDRIVIVAALVVVLLAMALLRFTLRRRRRAAR